MENVAYYILAVTKTYLPTFAARLSVFDVPITVARRTRRLK